MSELTSLRDHARALADWQPGEKRAACKETTVFGTPKPADHANCGGHRCGCTCHEPTEKERHLWRQIAGELDAYLGADHDVDLFGEMTAMTQPDPDGGIELTDDEYAEFVAAMGREEETR